MPLAIPMVSPKLMASIPQFYPQTITVQRLTLGNGDSWGAQSEIWTDLAGHVNISARVVSNGPGTGAGGWSGETRAPTGTYETEGLTMSLQGYYPSVTEEDRAIWNGDPYDIQAAESDASGVTTRLRVRKAE